MSDILHDRLLETAADIGRLKRLTDTDSYAGHLVNRLAEGVESMLLMLEPTAAQLAAHYYPGDTEAVDEAIRIVDAKHRVRRELLGLGA